MFVLLITLLFNGPKGPEYKTPPAIPLFFSEEACNSAREELTDKIKQLTHADKVIYVCTRAIPVNTGTPA